MANSDDAVRLTPDEMARRIPDAAEATRLHMKADKVCYIARSVNFPVHHEPEIVPV